MVGPITYRFSESDKLFLFFVIFTLVFLDENRVIFLQSDPPENLKISGSPTPPTWREISLRSSASMLLLLAGARDQKRERSQYRWGR